MAAASATPSGGLGSTKKAAKLAEQMLPARQTRAVATKVLAVEASKLALPNDGSSCYHATCYGYTYFF